LFKKFQYLVRITRNDLFELIFNFNPVLYLKEMIREFFFMYLTDSLIAYIIIILYNNYIYYFYEELLSNTGIISA